MTEPVEDSKLMLFPPCLIWYMWLRQWHWSTSKEEEKPHALSIILKMMLTTKPCWPLKISLDSIWFVFFLNISNENKQCTYPKLRHQDVSNAAQNCHTVKYVPGIFEIILLGLREVKKKAETREQWREWEKGEKVEDDIKRSNKKKGEGGEKGNWQERWREEKETKKRDISCACRRESSLWWRDGWLPAGGFSENRGETSNRHRRTDFFEPGPIALAHVLRKEKIKKGTHTSRREGKEGGGY